MMKTLPQFVLTAVLVTMCGCASVETTPNETTTNEGEQTFVVRGQYLGRAMDGEAMRVTHEEIPGYMAAMTMDLPLRDTLEVLELTEGDKIEFTLTLTEADGYAHGIEKLDPQTDLKIPK